MEFNGRIARVLPKRSGVSQRSGNQWESQPFVFEYFENDSDRYPDSVLLEAFDTNVIPYIREGLEVRIGFGHKTREWTNQEGKTSTFNELRMYKIESLKKAQQQQRHPAAPPVQQPVPQQQPINEQADDLPF